MEGFGLSDRELEILELLVAGARNKEIATRLMISANTVKVHLRNIYAKLNVNSRTEAVTFALRNNLVGIEGMAINGIQRQQSDSLLGIFSNLDLDRFRDRHLSWYLTLGFTAVLLIGIIGMLILVKGRGNGAESEGPSNVESESQRWQFLSDLPTARKDLAVTTYENQIYVIGGETKKGVSDFVERFDPLTNTWERLSDKPIPVTEVQAKVVGGIIYVPGGRLGSGEVSDAFEAFHPRSEKWETLTHLPKHLSAYAAVAFEGEIFIFGGWDGEKYSDSVFSYDPQRNVWTQKSAMRMARGYVQAEVAGGAIYVMGGLNESGPLDLNEAYFPQRENSGEIPWQTRAPLPEPRYAFGLTSVADILHLIGGLGESGSLNPLKYSPREDTWQTFMPPDQGTWSHMGVVSIEGILYVLGGQHGDKISAENLSYEAIYTVTLPLVQ
jgi:DNA-binding CsgD family transcriptional regulator